MPKLSDAPFFVMTLLFCIIFVTCEKATKVLYYLFLKMDFTHARILAAALLPMTILLAMSLIQLCPKQKDINDTKLSFQKTSENTRDWYEHQSCVWMKNFDMLARSRVFEIFEKLCTKLTHMLPWITGLAIALVLNFGIEWVAQLSPKLNAQDLIRIKAYNHNEFLRLNVEGAMRVRESIGVFILIMSLLLFKQNHPDLKKIAYITLCGFIAIQCLLAANKQVNGQQSFNFIHPFYKGDMYYARKDEFVPPTQQQLASLHKRLQPNKYRVALICDPELANGFCAGHVPEFWHLRVIDGYYGIGVPTRLRALPWPTGTISLRTISFINQKDVPWALLGFLNVSSIMVVNDGIYRNIVRQGEDIVGTCVLLRR